MDAVFPKSPNFAEGSTTACFRISWSTLSGRMSGSFPDWNPVTMRSTTPGLRFGNLTLALYFLDGLRINFRTFSFPGLRDVSQSRASQVIIGGYAGNIIFMLPALDSYYGIVGCIQFPFCSILF